jgi:hypothetical protein
MTGKTLAVQSFGKTTFSLPRVSSRLSPRLRPFFWFVVNDNISRQPCFLSWNDHPDHKELVPGTYIETIFVDSLPGRLPSKIGERYHSPGGNGMAEIMSSLSSRLIHLQGCVEGREPFEGRTLISDRSAFFSNSFHSVVREGQSRLGAERAGVNPEQIRSSSSTTRALRALKIQGLTGTSPGHPSLPVPEPAEF